MKALFIIGIVLIIASILYGISKTKDGQIAPKSVSYGILTGFVLIIISGVLYLK